jgi:hypothetical protein
MIKIRTLTADQRRQQEAVAGEPSNGTTLEDENSFAPTAAEIARKAYFNYENEGLKPGRDVQNWLKAETELIAERRQYAKNIAKAIIL